MQPNAIARVEDAAPVKYFGDQLATLTEVMQYNKGADKLFGFHDIKKIKFPGAGSLAWVMPGADGKPQMKEEFQGVILAFQEHRGYYGAKYEGGNEAPDCFAEEPMPGKLQTGSKPVTKRGGVQFGGACHLCPVGNWAIAEGGAKIRPLCRPRVRVYIQTREYALPIWVDLPSTSVQPFHKYMDALTNFNLAHLWVVTIFGLTMQKTAKGIDYPVLELRVKREMPTEEGKRGKPWVMSFAERTDIAPWRASIVRMIDPVNRAAVRAIDQNAALEAAAEEYEHSGTTVDADPPRDDEGSAASAYGVDPNAVISEDL